MNDKVERIWQENIVAYIEVLSGRLPGGIPKNLGWSRRCPGPNLKPVPLEYEAEVPQLDREVGSGGNVKRTKLAQDTFECTVL
jgi:hypothetical protein